VRRESSVEFGRDDNGTKVTFTRKGLMVSGWHSSGYGHVEGGSLTWEQIDAIRADLAKVQHRKDSDDCPICNGGTGGACSWHFL
jgi:hypothetical protein